MVGSRVSNASSRKIKKRGGNAAPEVVVLPVEVPPAPEVQKSGEEHHLDASTLCLLHAHEVLQKTLVSLSIFRKGRHREMCPGFQEKRFSHHPFSSRGHIEDGRWR